MWTFLQDVFNATGTIGLVCVLLTMLLFLVSRAYQKKDKKIEDLQTQLLEMSEKRREDVVEEREKYEDLAKDLHKSLDLLIKVFKRRNGNNDNSGGLAN